jgi:2',3'-cyclic-nucleotide 2'-phosphodiesterase (5'-nucleotidase family)
VIGNHDLDHGPENLQKLIQQIHATTLCANLFPQQADGTPPTVGKTPPAMTAKPFKVFERGGIRIGVIGLTTAELVDLVAENSFAGLTVLSPAEVLRDWWAELNAASDIQIVLSHCGVEADRKLAAAFPELEAIIGGHSHTYLESAERVGPVLVAQAGCNGRRVGRIELEIEGPQIKASSSELLIPLRPADSDIDPSLLSAEQELLARVQALEEEVIATLSEDLGRSYFDPSPLGRSVAAAFMHVANADVGFANSGGIRTDLEAGPFTQAALLALLPFDNELVRFPLTGEQLIAAVRHNIAASRNESHGILQISGLQWSVSAATPERPKSGDDVVLERITINGQPIEAGQTYICAGSDYITASRAQKYFGFQITGRKGVGLYVRDAFEQAVRDGALPGIVAVAPDMAESLTP